MSLINVSSAQPEPILLSGPASPIEITLKDLQNSISNETKAPESFSQIPAPQPLFKDLPSEKSTDLEEDPELIIFDSVKKPTIDTKPASLSRPESGNSGRELQGKEVDKSSQSPSWKPANTNVHSLKAGFDEKMSFKKSDENSLTCGSNLINVSKREIINLEDDEDEPIDTGKAQTSKISSQSVDSLIVNDPCMNGLAQSQEQLLKQLILKNMMNQAGLAMQRQQQQPPPLNPAQKAFMAAAQLLQMNQMAQRGFINPFGNMPFLGGNPAMMPQFSANYTSFNPMMNQGTYPNMFNRFQDNSLLGKRAEPQDGFGQQNERQVLKVNKLENNKRTEVIVLEDEESEEKGYRNVAVLWQAIQLRKKIFTVEKTSRKQMYKRPDTNKKQVFTIIRQKNQKNRFIRNKTVRQTKYLIHAQSKIKIVQKKEVAVKLKVDQDESELGKRKSIKLRREDVFSEGSEEYEDAKLDMLIENSVFSEETPIYDDYVINLHVDENEDNEDIIDTPIGREFQIKLLPFHGNLKAKRSVKCVWNPETEDQELIKSCFESLESKFDRKIVSEESALKILKKFDMDVDKVAEELEANSMAFKSLFTIRQKVRRSRIFNR